MVEELANGNSVLFEKSFLQEIDNLLKLSLVAPLMQKLRIAKCQIGKLPANTSLKLQMLDVGKCFIRLHQLVADPKRTLKNAVPREGWDRKVSQAIEEVLSTLKIKRKKELKTKIKQQYELFRSAIPNAFTMDMLRAPFLELGLCPERLNLDNVFDKCTGLKEIRKLKGIESVERMKSLLPVFIKAMQLEGRVKEEVFEANNIPEATPNKTATMLDDFKMGTSRQRAMLLLHEKSIVASLVPQAEAMVKEKAKQQEQEQKRVQRQQRKSAQEDIKEKLTYVRSQFIALRQQKQAFEARVKEIMELQVKKSGQSKIADDAGMEAFEQQEKQPLIYFFKKKESINARRSWPLHLQEVWRERPFTKDLSRGKHTND
jgi:hypothetical protein